jgi:CheY-like chemotaxis protein
MFQAVEVNIVILDYAMPDLNGAQVASRMRALKPDVPILMYSGLTTVPDDVEGQVDAFLVKGKKQAAQRCGHCNKHGLGEIIGSSRSEGVRQ